MPSVLITGVARGLGFALAKEFHTNGYTVFGTVRKQADVDALDRDMGAPHQFFIADASVASDMTRVSMAIQSLRPIDIVIANAGLINTPAPAWEISNETWRHAMDVNVLGMVNTIKAFLPDMIADDKGLFVGISSGWGHSASEGLAPYCASKFAVEGLFQSLAKDLDHIKSKVTTVALDPGGGNNTGMLATCMPDNHAAYKSPDVWAVRAVDYISNCLLVGKRSGSFVVPD